MKRLGKLKEILSQLIQLEKNSETAKDGRVIYWEGELAEGVALYVLDEEGNEVACPDGEVIIEDKKIVVADGKVSTIETVAAEEPQPTDEQKPEETDMKTDKASKFSAVVDFYSMSYDERWQLLYKAAEELYPDSFLYVEDAGDDYAIICLYGDDETKLYKYSVTWEGEENDKPILSNPVEVKRGYIPVNEETEPMEPAPAPAEPINEPADEPEASAMAEQMAELSALRSEVEELRAKLAQPAKMSEQKRLEEMESNENPTDKYAAIAAALRKR